MHQLDPFSFFTDGDGEGLVWSLWAEPNLIPGTHLELYFVSSKPGLHKFDLQTSYRKPVAGGTKRLD